MSFSDNKKFWTEFITLYREQRPVWDVTCKDYSNKHVKRECYDTLVEKLKEINSSANEKYVKGKIESLRASFRRELKKVKEDDFYEPNLWYFELLLFTADQERVRKSASALRSNVKNESEEYRVDDEVNEEDAEDSNNETSQIHVNPHFISIGSPRNLNGSSPPNSPPTAKRSRRKHKQSNNMSALDKKKESFLDIAKNYLTKEIKSTVFGSNVAFQLEDLDNRQRIIAEKLISDVIFHAKLNNLTEHSSISVKTNYPQFSNSSNNFQQ